MGTSKFKHGILFWQEGKTKNWLHYTINNSCEIVLQDILNQMLVYNIR